MFPSFAYVMAQLITQLPQSTIESVVFSLLVYWISGERWGPPCSLSRSLYWTSALLAHCRRCTPWAQPPHLATSHVFPASHIELLWTLHTLLIPPT
jgi:hypothetical protein